MHFHGVCVTNLPYYFSSNPNGVKQTLEQVKIKLQQVIETGK